MAGHSRPKDGVASARLCPAIHVFLYCHAPKTWMPGTRPGMTNFAIKCRYYWLHLESDLSLAPLLLEERHGIGNAGAGGAVAVGLVVAVGEAE